MTNKEYILSKLGPYGVTDAELEDMLACGICPEAPYVGGEEFGEAFAQIILEIALKPKPKSISENGFSISLDTEGLGKYYLAICRRYGITPASDVFPMLGISAITDMSELW